MKRVVVVLKPGVRRFERNFMGVGVERLVDSVWRRDVNSGWGVVVRVVWRPRVRRMRRMCRRY